MKKLHAIVFALLLLLLTTISAAAMEYKTISRQNGGNAYADWSVTSGDEITYSYLGVTNSNAGSDIYFSQCTYDMVNDEYSCKYGNKFTQEEVFTINSKLVSASLSAVEVELYDESSSSFETVSIHAEWTGTGDIIKDSIKYTSKFEDYIFRSSSSTSYRSATVTGSINNEEFGTSEYAGLAKFKSAYIDMKK